MIWCYRGRNYRIKSIQEVVTDTEEGYRRMIVYRMKCKRYLWLIVIGFVAVVTGCGSAKMERSKDLVVVEQTDTVYGGNEDNGHEWASFTVDVPVNGPEVLADSIMAFVNKELYDACESNAHFDEKAISFSQDKVFTNDGERLLSHYMTKYKRPLQDSLWRVFGLTMKMEAQTEKYVTYGVEFYYCGASCSSEKHFYTFDKKDGHQVKEVISHDNLVRFFEDYPEYSTIGADPWSGEPEWRFYPEYEFHNSHYGLMDDLFFLSIDGVGNHYQLTGFPYSQIFSYLSPEVQALVEQEGEEEPMLPAYLPKYSEDGQVWMELDTLNLALISCLSAADTQYVDTLTRYETVMEVYPKRVHSIDGSDGSVLYLFIYSYGHLLHYDEALICTLDEHSMTPVPLFTIDGERDSVINCMWYDQLVEASEGFPFYELDENRFGIYYDSFTKRLYIPIMENHEKGSGYENCLRYTGRYDVLQFKGKEFVPVGTDGAWWLNADMRNYKRTISNKKTADGIEQIDLMPDNTYRRSVWKGAKTLDDLRKKPDEVMISNNKDFNETD